MIKIEEAMEPNVLVLNKGDTIVDAAKFFAKNEISGAPVMDGDEIVGILSEGDIMKLLDVHSPNLNLVLPSPLDVIEMPIRMKHEYDETTKGIKRASLTLVEEIMISPVVKIGPNDNISDAAILMDKEDIKRIPVVDDEDNLIGIVTRGDIVKALVNYKG
ncbi:MAG: CBS domain-containing protein [Methanobrevibacter arboriphilus]|jgi:CBS domain-containing protein|uniref:CBS domain-containing protein n=3 Tax=Methanobrevibacter arboriphilus TaxID=39441 RepID=A0ACA8R155_METAZ|nr:CBS domain-containing protein [Methanobrevibacter arboriphilus]MBF4468576.1 CBS domain-containing protein [Methanobrevibacter arboriphilus]MCC7561354.1 CBS domain-containing protein [Methanobrevibacter arboriphilus]BBL61194.1 CBS domain-containing protein [Methanobrevibacter arboriphilus]GLI12832.1 CBS domain-containing protein [Methanobrevibacter arboriphilus]